MSGVTLSAAVRQNLLSLQATANLLSTTQTRLVDRQEGQLARSTIPTNFFTASGLDARASDINNLLDSIGNGVQVLQAANTGITSLTQAGRYREVDRQPGAAAATTGYSTKASVSLTRRWRRDGHRHAADLQRRRRYRHELGAATLDFKTSCRNRRHDHHWCARLSAWDCHRQDGDGQDRWMS